ncbi:membrane protein [Salmonella phage PHA46_2]
MNGALRQVAEQIISGTTGQVIDKAGKWQHQHLKNCPIWRFAIIRLRKQAVGGAVQSDETTGYSRMHWRFSGRP